MRSDYDFSSGVKGKYYKRYREDSNVVVLEPDVHKRFRNSAAVNKALRALIRAEAFASIKRGLKQAVRHARGKRVPGIRLHVAPEIDVKAVRERTGLTQEEFAAALAISVGALRHWERGDRKPRGTARVLLNVIAKEPDAVLRVLVRR